MNIKNIPTAEEFLRDHVYITKDDVEDVHDSLQNVRDMLIEFTKIHVETALKVASEKACLNTPTNDWQKRFVDKNSILNSYPLESIQ